MNKTLKAIRKTCIAANREIVELKFGCRVKDDDGEIWTATSYPDPAGAIFAENIAKELSTILSRSEYTHVIGRPIRLADVLLAIGKTYQDIGVNSEGQWENAMG